MEIRAGPPVEPEVPLLACDLGQGVRVDAMLCDVLARLQLMARRRGARLVIRNAPRELVELLDLMGLREVILCEGDSVLEPRRQAPQREVALGVEEERDPRDPPVG